MGKKHNYKNPSKAQDLSHLEAQGSKGKKYYDEQGWEISPPISDRECIPICPSIFKMKMVKLMNLSGI